MERVRFLTLAFFLLIFTRKENNPATLYALVKRIAHILQLPLTLHPSLAPELGRVKSGDPKNHKYDNVPPEVALMASMIIVLKMTYGLDGKPRYWRLECFGHRLSISFVMQVP